MPRKAAFALAVCAGLVTTGCETNPITGRESVQLLGSAEEQRLGARELQNVLSETHQVTDPAVVAPVRHVGSRVVSGAGQDPSQWRFLVLDDPTANAFALPGGIVAVNTGMLPVAGNEEGLATVISHEIGHVIARHSGERVSQDILTQLGIGVFSAMGGGNVAGLMGLGATYGLALPAARRQESEADYMGLVLMEKAGYDPGAAEAFWRRMQEASGRSGNPPEFLSDHPTDERRIQQIARWVPEVRQKYGQERATLPD